MRNIFMLSTMIFTFSATSALACSCGDEANPQQAAQQAGAIVARVNTKSLSDRGVGQVEVERVIKGNMMLGQVEINSYNVTSCASDILPPEKKSWIAIFKKNPDNQYIMISCGQGSLELDAAQNVKFRFSLQSTEEVSVNQTDFADYVNAKAFASTPSVTCNFKVNRDARESKDAPPSTLPKIDFSEKVSFKKDEHGGFEIDYKKDLSNLGLKPVSASGYISPSSSTLFKGYLGLTEPFYGVSTSVNIVDDLTKGIQREPLRLSAATDSDWQSTEANCKIDISLPLVRAEK